MSFNRSWVALVVGCLAFAPALAPLAGAGAGGPPEDPAEDARRHGVPPERLDRLMTAWKARVAERSAIEARLDAGAPAMDGFEGLTKEDQQRLAGAFTARMLREDAGFRANVRPAGEEESWQSREAFAAFLLYGMLFEPAALTEAFAPPVEAPAAPAADLPAGPTPFRDPLTGEELASADEVRARIAATRLVRGLVDPALADGETFDVVAPAVPTPAVPAPRDDVAPPALPATDEIARPTDALPPEEQPPRTIEDALARLDALAPAIPDAPTLLEVEDVALPPLPAIEGAPALADLYFPFTVLPGNLPTTPLTFTACAALASGPAVCLPAPVPLGTPVALDVDGNVATGVGGADVAVTLAPTAEPPTGPPSVADLEGRFGVTLTVATLPPAAGPVAPRALAASAFVAWSPATPSALDAAIDMPESLVVLGVDGTASRLPATTTLESTVDLLALARDEAHVNVTLATESPGSTLAVFSTVSELTPSGFPANPVRVRAALTPPPVGTTVSLDARFDGSIVRGAVDTSGAPDVDVLVDSARGSENVAFRSTIVDLPDALAVKFVRAAGNVATIEYDATSAIPSISGALTRSEAGRSTSASVAVTGLPDRVSLKLDPNEKKGSISYAASATVTRVAATFSDAKQGVTTTGSASVDRVPQRFDVTYDFGVSPAKLVYDASAPLGPVALALASGAGKLALAGAIDSVPRHVELVASPNFVSVDARNAATDPPGTAAFGAIVLALATDGQLPPSSGQDDHAVLVQTAAGATRVDLRYTGLKALTADLRNGETHVDVRNDQARAFRYSVDFPGAAVAGAITKVPARVAIDVVENVVTYDGFGQTVDQITMAFSDKGSPALVISADVRGFPARASVDFALERLRVTYAASGVLASAFATASFGPGKPAFRGSVASVPPFLELVAAGDFFSVDARSSPTAAPGSASVGTIDLAFGTDGTLLKPLSTDDHVQVQQPSATTTQVELKYGGLQLAKADLRNGVTVVEVRNVAPRLFRFAVNTPGASASGAIDKVPSRVTVTISGNTVVYDSGGQVVNAVALQFSDKAATPLVIVAGVSSIPGRIAVTFDLDAFLVTYEASGAVGAIQAFASVPVPGAPSLTLQLAATGLPPAWHAGFDGGNFTFDAPAGIGSINLRASNRPSRFVVPCATLVPGVQAPNRLCATATVASNLYELELVASDVKRVELTQLPGETIAEVKAVAGGLLVADVIADLSPTLRMELKATISSMPASAVVTIGDKIELATTSSFDLTLDVGFGSPAKLASVSAPPSLVHGVSVRSDGTHSAFRVHVRVTGTPTAFDIGFAPLSINATGWKPTRTTFDVDVLLPSFSPLFVGNRLDVAVSITGLVPTAGTTQDVKFFFALNKVLRSGELVDHVNVTAQTRVATGPIAVDVLAGKFLLHVDAAAIPPFFSLDMVMGSPTTTLNARARAPIASAFVGVHTDAGFTRPKTYQVAATLEDVPTRADIVIGSNGAGPEVNYAASASTLDLAVSIDPELFASSLPAPIEALRGRIDAGFTNLGASFRARELVTGTRTEEIPDNSTTDPCDTKTRTVVDKAIDVTSTPATDSFFADVFAEIDASQNEKGTKCVNLVAQFRLNYDVDVDVGVDVQGLSLSALGVSSLRVTETAVQRVTGTYDRLALAWEGIDLDLHVRGTGDLDVCLVFEKPKFTACANNVFVDSFDKTLASQVNVWFHRADRHFGSILSGNVRLGTPCILFLEAHASVAFTLSTRPDRHSAAKNSFTVFGAGSPNFDEGGNSKWYVLPDLDVANAPFLPSWIVRLLFMAVADSGDAALSATVDATFGGGACV